MVEIMLLPIGYCGTNFDNSYRFSDNRYKTHQLSRDCLRILGIKVLCVKIFGRNLRNATFSITNDTVEEFVCNGQITPALLSATGHCEIKAEQLFTDNAILTAAQTPGTVVTIIIGPNGTTTGKPKYTFTGSIITKLDLKWDQKSAVSNSFAAKGILSAVGAFT